ARPVRDRAVVHTSSQADGPHRPFRLALFYFHHVFTGAGIRLRLDVVDLRLHRSKTALFRYAVGVCRCICGRPSLPGSLARLGIGVVGTLQDWIDGPGLTIVYDGDCPFCTSYIRLLRIRDAAGPVRLVNAREDHDVVAEARS